MSGIEYCGPQTARFWASELFVALPPDTELRPLRRLKSHRDAQNVFDVFHGIEDGIELRPREELPRKIRLMRRLELTMDELNGGGVPI